MLVLSRNIGQSITIGNIVEVKVLSIDGNQIKLGFNAPRNISIYREEIQKRIQASKTPTNDPK